MTEKNKWLSITQFADQLGLSRYTIINLVKTGELKVFNISPGAKRPTYRLPQSQLSRALGLMETSAALPDSHGGEHEGPAETAVRDG
jgi:predicted site-specific integrase-resolvase